MNITPDQARELLNAAKEGHTADILVSAPDMAETIAGMTYEYAAQIKEGGEWLYLGLYGPDEPWGPEEDVRDYHSLLALPGTRIVRRLVGPVEVVE